MLQFDKQIRISRELARKLLPLAMGICVVISIVAPGAYVYLEFNRLKNESSLYARQLADIIRRMAAGSPGLWKYQVSKYSEIIEGFAPNKNILTISVLDENANPISQFDHRGNSKSFLGQWGIAGNAAPIRFNNTRIGTVRIHLIADAFLMIAFGVFIACFVIGLSLSVMIYRLPIGVVTRLEKKLLEYQNSLEELVSQRTMELQKTAERALQLAEARRHDQIALLEAKATLETRVHERTLALEAQVVAKKKALSELATVQDSLLEMSRAAGMAEVATGVLHNVGNVLNSVNVSCTLIMDQLRESRVGNLAGILEMITKSGNPPEQFLTQDPRGRKIPVYLKSLAPVLQEEHNLILRETQSLHDRIDHIKGIVTMQQTYGRVSGVLENILPEQLMEDALKMNVGELVLHEVSVQRKYQSVPLITVEKHKVLQILLNLIKNAKHACMEGCAGDKTITLRILNSGHDCLRMEISDNGVGISPENLIRIFQQGFTTRKAGHGFGLHSAALAAKELGGSLTARSKGIGSGATFALELPLQPGDG